MLTKEVRYIFSQSRDGHYVELEFTPREVAVLMILGQMVSETQDSYVDLGITYQVKSRMKVNAIKIARLTVGSLDPSNVHGTLLNAKRVIEWFAENHRSVDARENGDNVPKNLGDLLKSYLKKDPGMGDPDEYDGN